MSCKIIVVNYGIGNLASVKNMLNKVGADASISSCPRELLAADKIILPGVGHFDHGMKMLKNSDLFSPLNSFALEMKKPVLGICLGAQMLGRSSEEGVLPGLGWIDMECKKLPSHPTLRVPHMGWNEIKIQKGTPIFSEIAKDARYYFVHSYYMKCKNAENSAALTSHGIDFSSVVVKENVCGTQFHPEKSLKHGMKLFDSFVNLC